MAVPVSGLNPVVLSWARERAGLSIDEVARAFNKGPEVIESWEAGISAPTYVQLEKLAYQILKRPVALFFFPEPPDEVEPDQSFRTLPDFELASLSADTKYKIRRAKAFQLSLAELNDGVNPASRKLFRDVQMSPDGNPVQDAQAVREYLGVNLSTQTNWNNTGDAFKAWRYLVEQVGIQVFKDSLKQREVSGFCLTDSEFPIIYINNSTSRTRQIFTIFHELAHILFETSGITKSQDFYIDSLTGEDREIEIKSNQFAAEFLVPSQDFSLRIQGQPYSEDLTSRLAEHYLVSREVVLRKFLDLGQVTNDIYRNQVKQWAEEQGEPKGDATGGNYYATQATYLGESFLKLAFSRYYQGRVSIEELADHLNVKASNIPGLEPVGLVGS